MSGLRQGTYPSATQPLVDRLATVFATGCAQNDALAKAKTWAQFGRVKVDQDLPAQITEARLAVYAALGI